MFLEATAVALLLAALGESERARDALPRLREAHGRDALLRVQALRGPASPLATALLAETDTPYRG